MPNPARRTIALAVLAVAIIAGAVALDLSSVAAQSEDEQSGRIVAQRLADGRTEFGWQPAGAERVLPRARYFPRDAQVGRWLNSSPVEVGGAEIGRINARLLDDGRIEFAFTPTDGERIEPSARYFPVDARVGRWLRSTEIAISAAPTSGFVAVSAGARHTCAIRTSGEITCWGDNENGQTDAPLGSFSAVSAGNGFNCAIGAVSWEIECWGTNTVWLGNLETGKNEKFYFQFNAPAGTFSAVSAGNTHACGLRTNGAIECWTDEGPQAYDYESPELTPPPGSFSAVSAGAVLTCAIRTANGAIACRGDNEEGQATPPPGRFRAVSTGSAQHACAIRDTSAIECWGSNSHGQLDAPPGSFIAVSAGQVHTCAIRDTGAIECWGWVRYAPAGSFTAVSAGSQHTCAIRDTGAIECWGWGGEYGRITTPPAP